MPGVLLPPQAFLFSIIIQQKEQEKNMMIFACDFWWRAKSQKYYDFTIALMKGMDNRLLVTTEDLTDFVEHLKRQVGKDKPAGSKAHIAFSPLDSHGNGQVRIDPGKDETDIARLYFHAVKGTVSYQQDAKEELSLIVNRAYLPAIREKGGEL